MSTLILNAAAASGSAISLLPAVFPVNFGIFLANFAAAAIDAKFLYPALFKQDAVEGSRLNGLDFQKTDEGTPANRLFGGQVRTAGTLIWAGPLIEKRTRSGGGKGGAGGNFIVYKYFSDVAIEICRLKRGRTIKKVKKVIADGKVFYDEEGLVSTAGNTNIRTEVLYRWDSNDVDPLGPNDAGTWHYTLKVLSNETTGGPDLGVFQSGRDIAISGFTNFSAFSTPGVLTITTSGASSLQNGAGDLGIRVTTTAAGLLGRNDTLTIVGVAGVYRVTNEGGVRFTGSGNIQDVQIRRFDAWSGTTGFGLAANAANGANIAVTNTATNNNGSFRVITVGRTSSTESFFVCEKRIIGVNPFYEFSQRDAGNSITLIQDDRSFSQNQATDVRFYLGSRNQPQDQTIVDKESAIAGVGTANVPAFRGRAVMVIEDLELTDFGNRVPSFEFHVEVEEDDSLRTGISEMLLDSGLGVHEFDLTGIPESAKLGGYVTRGVNSTKSNIQPLLIAYSLLSQESSGRTKLIQRQSTSLVDVTNKTVAFSQGDESPPRPASFTEAGDLLVPKTAIVKYFDPDQELQVSKKQAYASIGESDQSGTFDSQLVLTATEAQRLANTLFESGYIGTRRSVQFDLPPSYLGQVSESMRVRLNSLGQDRQFLITRVEEGANYIVKCEAIEEDLEAYTQTATGEGPHN